MNSERLGYLISLYLDGGLAPAEKAELESALLSSASVRSQFWSETKLHEQLRVVEQEVYASDPPKLRTRIVCALYPMRHSEAILRGSTGH